MTIAILERGPVRLYSAGVARAMLRHEAQARSLGDRLRALHRGSELEKRRADLEFRVALALNINVSQPSKPLNFAALFPASSMLQSLQANLGLTYGGTTLAAGTTPPAGTLTGAPAIPVPVMLKCTTTGTIGGGALFAGYIDGVGSVPIMTGISPLAGAPVALGGACTGLSHAWVAGTATVGDTWQATCAALADQSGKGRHAAQANPAKQLIVSPGLKGRVSVKSPTNLLAGAGLTTVAFGLPAPGTTPTFEWGIWKLLSTPINGNSNFSAGLSYAFTFYADTGTHGALYNGLTGTIITMAVGSWVRTETYWSNSVADYLKFGAVSGTGVACGNSATTDYYLFGGGASAPVVGECLVRVVMNALPSPAVLAAATAAAQTEYSGLIAA